MKLQDISNLKKFIGKKVYVLLLLSVVAGVSWFLVELLFIYVFQYFLYTLRLLDRSQLSFDTNLFGDEQLVGIILLIVFGILRFLTSFFKTVMASFVQHTFIQEKRSQTLQLALSNAGKLSTGFILSIFSEIISQAGTMLFYVSGSIISGVSTLLFIIAGFYLLPLEMGISLGMLLLFLIPYKLLNRKIFTFGRILTDEWEKVNRSLIGLIKNNLFIKIYNLEDIEAQRGENSLKRYEDSYKKYTLNHALITLLPPFYGIIIVTFVSMLFLEKNSSSPINLVSFLYLFLRMAQSSSETLGTLSFIKLNKPAFEKLSRWLSSPKHHSEKIKITSLDSIEFKQVSFEYTRGIPILRNINFSGKKNDFIVIKGPSGAGKSTLLSLIMGIQTPSSGKIIINGKEEQNFTLSASIGYVGPIPYLLNETIKRNLTFGNSLNFDDHQIHQVLKALALDNAVKSFPLELNEILNEDAQLSTGQKQRVCIARALLQKPEILILDEATANLDSESELRVIQAIKEHQERTLVIVVTHKNSFDNYATSIINMDFVS